MQKFLRPVDQNLQNKINRSIIYNYIREHDTVSRVMISKNLKISGSSVTRLISDLLKGGYIVETEKVITSVGKRPILLQINTKDHCVLSVDLSQERLKISVNDFSGNIISKFHSFKVADDPKIIGKLIAEIKKVISIGGKNKKSIKYKNYDLKAISIGLPADVDKKTSEIISGSLYKSWYKINFKKELEREFKLPVFVEKDVILSVFAEKILGRGKDYKEIIFIEISSGVGSGMIVDNNIMRGMNNSSGQIGYMITGDGSCEYDDTGKGSIDNVASFQSIRDDFVKKFKSGNYSTIKEIVGEDISRIDIPLIFQEAYKNDKLACEIISEKAHIISKVLANMILVLNPEIIILGGNIADVLYVEELFIPKINENIKKLIPFKLPEIKLSQLKEDVVLIGGALFSVNNVLDGVFPYKI